MKVDETRSSRRSVSKMFCTYHIRIKARSSGLTGYAVSSNPLCPGYPTKET
jgi:hypothetical protein